MTEQTVEMEIPTETCTYDIQKMVIYIITSFVSGFFLWDVSAATPISVFSLMLFRFVFLCKRDCFDGKNKI